MKKWYNIVKEFVFPVNKMLFRIWMCIYVYLDSG